VVRVSTRSGSSHPSGALAVVGFLPSLREIIVVADVVQGEGHVIGGGLHALGLDEAARSVEQDDHNMGEAVTAATHSAGADERQQTGEAASQQRQIADDIASRMGAPNPPEVGVRIPHAEPHYVIVDPHRFPKTALHTLQAQEGTSFRSDESTAYPKQQPQELTYDPAGNENNERRAEALRGIPVQPNSGMDRDEYPPAVFGEGGQGYSVKYVPSPDNQGAGASMGRQLRGLDEGSRVRIVVG
jgi:hypothetical protein